MKKLALIEAPICVGAPTFGTEEAYAKLTEAGLPELLGSCELYPMALSDDERSLAAGRQKTDDFPPDLLYLNSCTLVSENLRKTVKSVLTGDDFPVVIGGDHSCCMGTLAALGETYGPDNVALIYIDAHADINTPETSDSHRIHGMDLAEALDLTGERLHVGEPGAKIRGQNMFLFGTRSVDGPEWNILKENGVSYFTAEDLGLTLERTEENRKERAERIRNEVLSVLPKLYGKKILVSLDVDSMDGNLFRSTGYRIPNGFTQDEIMIILTTVFGVCHRGMDGTVPCPYGELAAFECVEYNPSMDENDEDLMKLMAILSLLQSVYTRGI